MAFAAACGSSDVGSTPETDGGPSSTFATTIRAPARPLCVLRGAPRPSGGDELVWSDEFDGTSIDENKWNVFDGSDDNSSNGVPGTFARPNIATRGGSLFVATTRSTSTTFPYATGRIDTANHFARSYGRMEARARFPIAPGFWYAIWARPWATPFPEIDIEVLAKTVPEIWMVNHWAGGDLPPEERRVATKVTGFDATTFHVYAVSWLPTGLRWTIDGITVFESTRGVPTTPIHWTINSWVGGWAGSPTPSTPVPTSFEVDYIRFYREGGLIGEPAIRMTRFERHGGAPYNVPPYHSRKDALELEVANFDEACFHVEMREGDKVLNVLDRAPFRFPLDVVPIGKHRFTFVATDGERSTTQEVVTETY